MEATERALLEDACEHDFEIKKLYEKHLVLDEKVAVYNGRPYLTEDENVEVKRLKHEKLLGKRRMMDLLEKFKQRRFRRAGVTH